MSTCNHCGAVIIFGGKRAGELRFCSEKCLRASGAILAAHELANQVPEELLMRQVASVHQGVCPRCGRPGPVDVHVSHHVWSFFHVTSWKSRPQVSCRVCGVKSQCGGVLFSILFGWWGFPFGFMMTPVQIGRNLVGIFRAPDPTTPSDHLAQMVRSDIAKRASEIQAMVERERRENAVFGISDESPTIEP
jgi:hypothetical protein